MDETPVSTISEHFSKLEDPRRYNRRHLLLDMIVIAICAAICGADTWVDVLNLLKQEKVSQMWNKSQASESRMG